MWIQRKAVFFTSILLIFGFACDGNHSGSTDDEQGDPSSEGTAPGDTAPDQWGEEVIEEGLAKLPVYISADSILDAIHRSYDNILAEMERSVLISDLEGLLDGMRGNLRASDLSGLDEASLEDLDLFLAVALSLLDGEARAPMSVRSSPTSKR